MNQPTDDFRLRELFQRLKSVERQDAPAFDEILTRSRTTAVREQAGARWVFAACAAAVLLGAFLLIGSRLSDPALVADSNGHTDNGVEVRTVPHPSLSSIDFDHLRQVVHDQCHVAQKTNFTKLPLWTSRTDALIALSGDFSSTQE